ncbi:hypothetical protein GWI33_009105 [Rhynchophorus ferrugineus]|uniref:Uncharacterized protein n=1 Tax=Rhynchophorus ferrugineus TaxID=354439 RepID=A0A834IF60_RHYFE|nr:hypothetical protein GWI33_009105 [Rhynchophorus ferrugineus]
MHFLMNRVLLKIIIGINPKEAGTRPEAPRAVNAVSSRRHISEETSSRSEPGPGLGRRSRRTEQENADPVHEYAKEALVGSAVARGHRGRGDEGPTSPI